VSATAAGRLTANLADLLRDTARRAPTHPALVVGELRLSWGEVDALVEVVASGLRARGLAPGDRVALLLGNSVEFVVCYFGAVRAGLVTVPMNPLSTSAEMRAGLDDTGARLLVTDVSRLDIPGVQVVVVGEPSYDALLDEGRIRGPVPTTGGGEDLAVLLQTAGTGGLPKRAMLSHRALLSNLDQCAAMDPAPVSRDDVVLLVLPLFHVYGLNAVLGQVVHAGATAVLAQRFDPAGSLALIRDAGVTSIPAAPAMLAAWVAQPDAAEALKGVRLVFCGSAPLPPDVFGRFGEVAGKHVHEGYGLTEAAPVVATTLGRPVVKPGSVGVPIPGVQVRLVDAHGDTVDEGDPGELLVRGANLFSGYWPEGEGGPDADGWYATGDVAYADADGDLFLVSSRKDLVLVSGFNVYPREIEQVVAAMPSVREVAVIAAPDPATGQAVKALVVPEAGATVTPADVQAYCAGRLARFKCPTVVEIVSELPRAVTGTVAKGRLREREAGS
jgi:long-chain acyl-CoA synthetase